MSPELTELARRAVACKHWRWMPGMVTVPPLVRRLSFVDMLTFAEVALSLHDEKALPDLTDPATLGCLLALVREAWGDSFLSPHEDWCHKALWSIKGRKPSHPDWLALPCHSEAEALVAALEAAP